jgi:hypothetical protein
MCSSAQLRTTITYCANCSSLDRSRLLEGWWCGRFLAYEELPLPPRLLGARVERYPPPPEGLDFQALASVETGRSVGGDYSCKDYLAELRPPAGGSTSSG